jgi:hypothetical protein
MGRIFLYLGCFFGCQHHAVLEIATTVLKELIAFIFRMEVTRAEAEVSYIGKLELSGPFQDQWLRE